MAHKTIINGTDYEVTGGTTLVDGTGRTINGGSTLVDGTGYGIEFIPNEFIIFDGANGGLNPDLTFTDVSGGGVTLSDTKITANTNKDSYRPTYRISGIPFSKYSKLYFNYYVNGTAMMHWKGIGVTNTGVNFSSADDSEYGGVRYANFGDKTAGGSTSSSSPSQFTLDISKGITDDMYFEFYLKCSNSSYSKIYYTTKIWLVK